MAAGDRDTVELPSIDPLGWCRDGRRVPWVETFWPMRGPGATGCVHWPLPAAPSLLMPETPSWNIETTIPTLAVPELEMGIEYYERLGFSLDWRFPLTNPTHAGLVLGSCSIMLSLCEPKERADLYFIVDDIRACYQAIVDAEPWDLAEEAGRMAQREDLPPARARLAPPEPKATAYGLTDFSMVDPWGHHLTFGQPKAPRA